MVTNALNFLPQADQIIVLENGVMVESGTYDELRKKESTVFNEFVKNTFGDKEVAEETTKTGDESGEKT